MGYGQFEFSKQKGGLCCCWSLKNVEVCNVLSHWLAFTHTVAFGQSKDLIQIKLPIIAVVCVYSIRNVCTSLMSELHQLTSVKITRTISLYVKLEKFKIKDKC